MSAKISWMIYEDETYLPYNTYMADGTYSANDVITRRIQVWNNYQGISSVDDIVNAKLVLSFKNFEDNFLLHLINVKVGNNDWVYPNIDTDRGVIEMRDLSGLANNGSLANAENYCDIEFRIGPLPANIKCELKSLYFYLEYGRQQ